jgi:transposase
MVYVGLDVHRKRTQVAIMDDSGKQIANRNVTNDPGQLMPLLAALEPGTPVAFESAYGWGWVAELLDDLDLEPHLAHAKNCKAIASARLKNDKVDAATLAHLLRADLLAEAHIASKEVRDLRRTLRHRVTHRPLFDPTQEPRPRSACRRRRRPPRSPVDQAGARVAC